MAAWSSGIVSACGVMGREIESRQGLGWQFFKDILGAGIPVLRINVNQGCQAVYFHTNNPDLGKFCRVLERKLLVYFIAIWNILRPYSILSAHLEYFVDSFNIHISPFLCVEPR
jgi:hypothetical protein